MLRPYLAVFLGYVSLVVVMIVASAGAYTLMGAEGAFKPGSYEPSGLWLTVMFVFGFVAALVGGLVCGNLARSATPSLVLVGLVLVLGLIMAIPVVTAKDDGPTVRAGDVDNVEALRNARQPGWVALTNPFLGALGVFIGSRFGRPRHFRGHADPERST
jgi:hypothetical protein